MNRFELFFSYLRNNRICEYKKIIETAINNNYEIVSLRDYAENKFNKSQKILILRHDIDHISKGSRMMLDIEKSFSVHSSFYFRNSTYQPLLMKEIENYGSEASLHFEPIADFIKANPEIRTKEDLFKTNFQERCLNVLKSNIERFRLLCDLPCTTIASHGEYENSLVKTPNNYLTENESTYASLGIKLEAYNKNFINQITCYISDSPIEINEGYKYGTSPIKAITRNEPLILFLSHPNHWHYNFKPLVRKLIKAILIKPDNTHKEFKRL